MPELIKMDIEGAEHRVISILKREDVAGVQAIVMEIHSPKKKVMNTHSKA